MIDGTVAEDGHRLSCERAPLPAARRGALAAARAASKPSNLGDIAKQIVERVRQGAQADPDNQECENGIRANKVAVGASPRRARASRSYPKATIVAPLHGQRVPGHEERTAIPRASRGRTRSSPSPRQITKLDPAQPIALPAAVRRVQGEERHGEAVAQDAGRADERRSDQLDAARAGHRRARELRQGGNGGADRPSSSWRTTRAIRSTRAPTGSCSARRSNYKEAVPAGHRVRHRSIRPRRTPTTSCARSRTSPPTARMRRPRRWPRRASRSTRATRSSCCSRRRTSARPASFRRPRRRSQRALADRSEGAGRQPAARADLRRPEQAGQRRRGGEGGRRGGSGEQGARRAVPAQHRQHTRTRRPWHSKKPDGLPEGDRAAPGVGRDRARAPNAKFFLGRVGVPAARAASALELAKTKSLHGRRS